MFFLLRYVLFSSLTWQYFIISRLLHSGKTPHRAIISDFLLFFP